MTKRPIGAVTFDLWDCLFCDETDEPKRKDAGRPPKPEERRQLVYEYLSREAPIDRAAVDLAYNVADAAYRKVWHDLHVTMSVRERLEILITGLGRTLPVDFDALVRIHEDMELEFRPDPAPGAMEALQGLHGKYPLAIISDTIFSPGTNLRKLLNGAGMLEYFDHFVFSDELGNSKPHPRVFESVAEAFSIDVKDIVHIGDRPHNDIGGPHAVGARGLLLTVVKERPLEGHEPDAVCSDYSELTDVLEAMNGSQ